MTSHVRPMTMLGGRYRLVAKVAAGGQGEVWRAEDTALGRPVAVKVLRAELAGHPEFRARFRREAQLAGGLAHPGVARVFDFDEGRGDTPPYLVMEFVDGEPLSALIAREAPMSPARALDIVAAAAAALAAAHAAGLVHRDVKPGNLLVGRDGSVKITDFGIARAVDAVPLTRTGTLLGTPLYLSPEQAAGGPATAASDLYALGVIAFQLLTGRTPYEGPAVAVLAAHRDAPLPPLPASVPAPVRDLVHALTAKDPARRPPGAAAVADWINALRSAPPPGDRATRTPPGAGMTRTPPGPPPGDGATRTPPGLPPGDDATRVLLDPLDGAPPYPPAAGASRLQRFRPALPFAVGGLVIALIAGSVGWLAHPSASPRPTSTRQAPSSPAAPAVSGSPTTEVQQSPVVPQPKKRPKKRQEKPPKQRRK